MILVFQNNGIGSLHYFPLTILRVERSGGNLWRCVASRYDTLPGTGFTGSGTIFSLVTTAGKFNRERLFWSLYEVSSNFTADMLFCFVSPSLCKFYNSGSTKQIWFSLPDSSLEHSNSWPTQHSCQESVSKMNFSYWFYLQK